MRHRSAGNKNLRAHQRQGSRLERGHGRRQPSRLCLGGGDGSALHSVYLRHHRTAQGRGARQRRTRRGAQVDDEEHLRRGARRGLLGGLGRRLGGGSLLHCLRAAAGWKHYRTFRGQTGGHPGCGRFLAGDLGAQGVRHVHRANRLPGDQERRSQGRADQEL